MVSVLRTAPRLAVVLAFAGLLLAGCGGGGSSPAPPDTTPTWNASGEWIAALYDSYASDPLEADNGGVVRALLVQNGNDVTLTVFPDGQPDMVFTGTVSAATYTLSAVTGDPGGANETENVTVTLTSPSEGAGTQTWSRADGAVVVASGGGSIEFVRKLTPLYDVTGNHPLAITGNWSDPVGFADTDDVTTIPIQQTGERFTIDTGPEDPPVEGYVSGNQYLGAMRNDEPGGSTWSYIRVTFTSATAGTGTLRWVRNDPNGRVRGGANLTVGP